MVGDYYRFDNRRIEPFALAMRRIARDFRAVLAQFDSTCDLR